MGRRGGEYQGHLSFRLEVMGERLWLGMLGWIRSSAVGLVCCMLVTTAC